MKKNKKIIISAVIALCLILIGNRIFKKYTNTENVGVYTTINTILAGENIQNSNLEVVYIKKENSKGYIAEGMQYKLKDKVAINNITKGKILQDTDLITKKEYEKSQDKVRVIIPLNKACNAMAYKISKGDNINVYFTAKASQIENILEDEEKIYSTNNQEGFVTVKILEKTTVLGLYDENGNQKDLENFNQVMLMVDRKMALVISNLKEQGVFDICLMN